MPFAQVHYPFENREWFDTHAPADFIVEYVAQTRGWFYTLMVLSTALFDREPFANCICHGVVQDEEGQKLSKRLKNYPDPDEVFATHGSDALRWFLCSSPVLRGGDLTSRGRKHSPRSALKSTDLERLQLLRCTRTRTGSGRRSASDAKGVLDRYVLAVARDARARDGVDGRHDLAGACAEIARSSMRSTTGTIRRGALEGELDQDKKDAYDTLYTVLTTLCGCARCFCRW
jgi:isoleucyl-tRNA synthetase